MKLFTCSKLVSCIVMLHVGMTVEFENTMVKDLDPFTYNSLFSLYRTAMSISCCNYSSVSVIIIVPSAYLKLVHSATNSETSLSFNVPYDNFSVQWKQIRQGDTTPLNALLYVN